jgi:imidazolonepropionase-like amidohydrolase
MQRSSVYGHFLRINAFLLLLVARQAIAETTIVHAGWLLAEPGGQPLHRQSVIIVNDRISEVRSGFVQPSDLAEAGSEVRVIDLAKDYVLPGLIDAHVHLASSPYSHNPANPLVQSEADLAIAASAHAEKTLQAGFTTVVDLGAVGIAGHERAIFAVRDNIAKGRIAGPRIIAAGTPIAATGSGRNPTYRDAVMETMDMRSLCDGADDCRRAVREQVKRGSDIIVFFNTGSLLSANPVPTAMTDMEMRAIVETAHALDKKVIADGHHAAGVEAAHRAGADILDSIHLYDASTFRTLRRGVFVQSHIFGVVQAVGATEATLHAGLWGWLPDSTLRQFLEIRSRPFAVIEAWRAGIRNISYASDAGVYEWGDNAADLAEFVARGIPAGEAIRFATSNPARMLALDDELGSVAAGKKADLIACSQDPLDDISALQRIHFVMRDGRVHRHGFHAVPID